MGWSSPESAVALPGRCAAPVCGTRNGRLQAAGRIVWAVSDPQGGPRVADGACTRLSVSWGARTGPGTEAPGEDRCCSAVEVHLRVLRTARVVSRPAGTPRRASRLHGPIHVPLRVRKHLVHAHRLLEARDPYRGADVVLAARTSTRSTFTMHYRGRRARPIQTHHEPLRNGSRARAGHLDNHRSRNDLKSTKSTVFFARRRTSRPRTRQTEAVESLIWTIGHVETKSGSPGADEAARRAPKRQRERLRTS